MSIAALPVDADDGALYQEEVLYWAGYVHDPVCNGAIPLVIAAVKAYIGARRATDDASVAIPVILGGDDIVPNVPA